MFKKINDERTIGCKAWCCKRHNLKISIRIYSYLKVREGNERDVVRFYWYMYLSALCRFNGTYQSADIRIILNDPLLPATIGVLDWFSPFNSLSAY